MKTFKSTKKIMSFTLAIMILLSTLNIGTFKANAEDDYANYGWSYEEIIRFSEKVITDEDETYVEVEDEEDIKFFILDDKYAEISINPADIGKKILIDYEGFNPLEILEREDIVGLAPGSLGILYEYIDDNFARNEYVEININNIKYIAEDSLGRLNDLVNRDINLVGLENLEIIGYNAFVDMPIGKNINLESAVYIGGNAFFDGNLRSVSFGRNLDYIGYDAFALNEILNIEGLRNVNIQPGAFNGNKLQTHDAYIINNNNELVSYGGIKTTIKVPEDIKTMHIKSIEYVGVESIDFSNVDTIYFEDVNIKYEDYDLYNIFEILIEDNVEMYVTMEDGTERLSDYNGNIRDGYYEELSRFLKEYSNEDSRGGHYVYEPWKAVWKIENNSNDKEDFTILEDGTLIDYLGNSADIVIPEFINGIKVVKLDKSLFRRYYENNHNYAMRSLTIMGEIDTVDLDIGNHSYGSKIEEVIFMQDVGQIKTKSFYKVDTIVFNGNIQSLDNNISYYISDLKLLKENTSLNITNKDIVYWSGPNSLEVAEGVYITKSKTSNLNDFIDEFGEYPMAGYYKRYYDDYESDYFWIRYDENNVDFAGGKGTFEEPYLIANVIHFQNALNQIGEMYYKQINDLDMTDFVKTKNKPFQYKVYDGNNYKITNIGYNNYDYSLFGEVDNSEIYNLNIEDINLENVELEGILSNRIYDGYIHDINFKDINITATSEMSSYNAFGLIAGEAHLTLVENIQLEDVQVNYLAKDINNNHTIGLLFGHFTGNDNFTPNRALSLPEVAETINIDAIIDNVELKNVVFKTGFGNKEFGISQYEETSLGLLIGETRLALISNINTERTTLETQGGIINNVGGISGVAESIIFNNLNINTDISVSALNLGGITGRLYGSGQGDMEARMSNLNLIEAGKDRINLKNINVRGKINNKADYYPIYHFLENMYLPPSLEMSEVFPVGTGGLVGIGLNVEIESALVHLQELIGPVGLGGLIGTGINIDAKDIEIRGNINTSESLVRTQNAGGIAGNLVNSSLVGIDYVGDIKGEDNVGLVGNSINNLISKISHQGDIKGLNNVGGTIGKSSRDNINRTTIYSTVSGENNVGGIIGSAKDSRVYRANLLDNNIAGKDNVGTVIGEGADVVINETRASNVELFALNNVGIIGGNFKGSNRLLNSYTNNVGFHSSINIVGEENESPIGIMNFYQANNNGNNVIYRTENDFTDYNTTNMKEQNNYVTVGFDFENTWRQAASKNNKLPYLWWEYPGLNEELSEAYLVNLSTDEGTLTPEFDKYGNYYEVKLSGDVEDITIYAEAEDNGTIKLDNEDFNYSKTVSLSNGNNIINIKVISKDGIKTNVYTLNVIKNADIFLSNLEIEGVELNPSFDPNYNDYNATVNENVNSVTINTETNENNDVYVNNQLVENEKITVDNLQPGKNTIIIKVMSKDKSKQIVYVVQIEKEIVKNDTMITYFPNNVEWGNTTRQVEYIENGEPQGAQANPKTGYDFSHWETIEGVFVTAEAILVPEKRAEAYVAIFQPKEYIVNFLDINGEIIKSETVKYKSFATPPTPPVLENKVFVGWSNDEYLEVTKNLDTNAMYKEQGKYLVTYNSNNADQEAYPNKQEVLEGNLGVGMFPTPPIKVGYKFKEWNTRSDGNGQTFTTITPVTEDIELFAQYLPFHMSIEANPQIIVADGESKSLITVILKDENGIPVKNALVEIEAERGSFPEGNATVTNEYGIARLRFQSEEIKSTSRTNVKVIATVTDKENGLYGTAEISMIFEPSHISGVVLDKNNKPVQYALVVVNDPSIGFYAETLTDSFGRYNIPIAEGNRVYEIQITKPVIVGNKAVDVTFEQKAVVGNITGEKLEIISAEKTLTGIVKIKDKDKKEKLTGTLGGQKIEIKQLGNYGLDTVGTVNENGLFKINNLDENKEFLLTTKFGDKDLIIGKFVSNADSGEIKIQEELIDPYGTIRNSYTKDIVGNAEVKLYYANTPRNIAKGNTPDTLVPLPIIPGFLPSDNANPQKSTVDLVFNNDLNVMDHGNYAWLVFSESDYYILATHEEYYDYDSRKDNNLKNGTISVEWDIVKFNFEMKPIRTNEDLEKDERVVTFLDWDETVLKREVVKIGGNAIAPANPIRLGYKFIGWDKSFDNIQSDLIVKALYEIDSRPSEPSFPDKPYYPSYPSTYSSDNSKYNEAKEKLDNLIPYTVLLYTTLDLHSITGIDKDDLSYSLDTTKIGVTTLKADLMGRKLEYKIEVIDLVKNSLVFIEKPNHWAIDYARDVIDKGFIVGYTDGSIGLENILTYAESFTALDRLLLKNNLVELNISRPEIEKRTNIFETAWYHYTVKSILSKYTAADKITQVNYNEPISREEIAQILYNSFNGKLKENKMMVNYVDDIEIKNKEAVIFAFNTGLMVGMPDGRFAPQKTLTRAEFMTILSRLDNLVNQ